MKVGTLFDIEIHINKLLVAIIMIAVLAGKGTEVGGVFLIIFFHEMAHVLMARVLHFRIREIDLLPFGGALKIEGLFELNPEYETLIAAAGPLSNILMVLIYVSLQRSGMIGYGEYDFFLKTNLMLAGFNLLPALPLDGGRMLRAILSREIGVKKATKIAANGGIILAILLFITGIYAIYLETYNPTFFITAGFLFYSAIREKRVATYIFLRDITYKKDTILKEGALPIKELVVLYWTPLKEVIGKFSPHRYHYVRIVDEQLRTKGSLSETQIMKGLVDFGINVPVARLLYRKK